MELLYIVGFIIYLIYSVVSAGKNPQKKGQGRKPVQRPRQQVPQQNPQQRPANQTQRKTGGPKSLEEMLQEIYQETNTPNPTPVQQAPPPVRKVETYDDDLSYDEMYESYDARAGEREAQYEGEVYEKRKQKEITEILNKRKNKKHLSGTMKAQKRVKKEVKIRDFKFNARDAIIYDIIMNKPKF